MIICPSIDRTLSNSYLNIKFSHSVHFNKSDPNYKCLEKISNQKNFNILKKKNPSLANKAEKLMWYILKITHNPSHKYTFSKSYWIRLYWPFSDWFGSKSILNGKYNPISVDLTSRFLSVYLNKFCDENDPFKRSTEIPLNWHIL